MNISKKTARLAVAGVITALAFILSYLESLLPPLTAVPGIKPGLANIATMVAMYVLGVKEAVAVAVVRVILSGLTFNGMSAMLYGLAGTALSLVCMLLLKKTKRFSMTAVSLAGGIAHNIGQTALACIMLGKAIIAYLPVLLISGTIAGLIVGLISDMLSKRIVSAYIFRGTRKK